jgi:hypothetical protein
MENISGRSYERNERKKGCATQKWSTGDSIQRRDRKGAFAACFSRELERLEDAHGVALLGHVGLHGS